MKKVTSRPQNRSTPYKKNAVLSALQTILETLLAIVAVFILILVLMKGLGQIRLF